MKTVAVKNVSKKKIAPVLRYLEFKGEWSFSRLKEGVELVSGQHLTPGEYNNLKDGVPYFTGPSDFTNDETQLSKWTTNSQHIGKTDDVLITVKGSGVGRILLLHLKEVAMGRQLMAIRSSQYSSSFVYQCLLLRRKLYEKLASGNMIPGLSRQDILQTKLFIPSFQEQQKIADFLSAVDEKIQQLTRKKKLLEQYKKGVLQKIFSQEIRFKDKNGEDYPGWTKKRLGEIFEHRSEKGYQDLELLSVTINKGIKKRTEIEGKDNSNDDKSNYKKVCVNDIVYNSMRMWQGASGVCPYKGIVSPAYTVLKGNNVNSSEYFGYLFKMRDVIFIFQRHSQGLTSDTWNLKYPQLAKIVFKVPSLKEQNEIASFIKRIDEKINQVTNQLEQTRQFKKGLLQQMFV